MDNTESPILTPDEAAALIVPAVCLATPSREDHGWSPTRHRGLDVVMAVSALAPRAW